MLTNRNPSASLGMTILKEVGAQSSRPELTAHRLGRQLTASSYPLRLTSRFSCAKKNSASSISAGVVIFMLRGEPITT